MKNSPATTNETPNAVALSDDWFDATVNKINRLLESMTENMKEVGALYVRAIERNPAFRDHLIDEKPGVPASFWRSLEAVGRGQLDDRIMSGAIPYGNRLRKLTIAEQRLAIDNPVMLLTSNGENLQIRLGDMGPDQVRQVFARDHIRAASEQKAWLESERTALRQEAKDSKPDIEVDRKRGRIVIGHVSISTSELAEYLRKLTE